MPTMECRAQLEEELRKVRQAQRAARDRGEQARWRAYGEAMDRVRTKVGPDFDVIEVLTELRSAVDQVVAVRPMTMEERGAEERGTPRGHE